MRGGTSRGFAASCVVVTGLLLGGALAGAQSTSPPPNGSAATAPAKPLSKAEQQELLGSVDSILAFASGESGLAIHETVKRRLVSREEVTTYLRSHFAEDESAKRLERSELVLKKFGLLPREFALEPFLLSLLTEQIAGYYDDKTKTVNLLSWVAPVEQKPVLAHELTHALQDQAVGLERWSDSGVHGIARTAAEQDAHLRTDEFETARSAVAEGQAMVVFFDYGLRDSHRTLLDVPDVVDRLLSADPHDNESPVLAKAPPVLVDSLLFPYTNGLAFEVALLRDGGKQRAFADVLRRPPSSSWEVMTPAAYLARRAVPAMMLPDLSPELAGEYAPYDVGVMGELDVRTLAETFDSSVDAKALAAKWDGGVYYAAQRKAAAKAGGTGSIAVLYASRWRDEATARRFAAVYRAELGRKYRRLVRVGGEGPGGEEGQASASLDDAGEALYSTEEGDVLVAVDGRTVFVAEGFDATQAERLKVSVLRANAGDSLALVDPGLPARGEAVPAGEMSARVRELAGAHYTFLRRLGDGRAEIGSARGAEH